MKAVYLTEHGGLDVLTYGDLPDPVAGPGEAVVRVRACGVNHVDLWLRKGLPFMKVDFPFIPGADIAGEVASIGPGTTALPVGTRVVVNPGVSCGQCERCLTGADNLCPQYRLLGEPLPGGYAELVKAPAANLVAIPDDMSFETAAALPAAFGTAWNMVFDKAQLVAGEWVLVQAGGSGVGTAAIQLALMTGARVITTVGSDDKVDKAKALGAHHVINYKRHDFLHEVQQITGARGVDVVIEHIGGEVFERSLRCLVAGGRLVTCGATAGYQLKTDVRDIVRRNLRVLGSTTCSKGRVFRIVRLAHEGKLRASIDRVLPLSEARLAHQLLEQRQQFGKVILVP